MKKFLALPVLVEVVAVIAALPASAFAHRTAGPQRVLISAGKTGYAFDKKTLSAPAGTEFLLVFTNNSTQKHNVSLELGELEYGATLTVGKSSTATIFTLKKGAYHFYSSVGKDETKGMSGTLTVR